MSKLVATLLRVPKAEHAPLCTGYLVDPTSHLGVEFKLTQGNLIQLMDETRDKEPALLHLKGHDEDVQVLRRLSRTATEIFLGKEVKFEDMVFFSQRCTYDLDYYSRGREIFDFTDLSRRGTEKFVNDELGRQHLAGWDAYQRVVEIIDFIPDAQRTNTGKYLPCGKLYIKFGDHWAISVKTLVKKGQDLIFTPLPQVKGKDGSWFDVCDFRTTYGLPIGPAFVAALGLWTTAELFRKFTLTADREFDFNKRSCGNCAWRKSLSRDDVNGVGSSSIREAVEKGYRPHMLCLMTDRFIDQSYEAYMRDVVLPLAGNSERGKKSAYVKWGEDYTHPDWIALTFLRSSGLDCEHHCYGGALEDRETGEVTFMTPEAMKASQFPVSFDSEGDAIVRGPSFFIRALQPLYLRQAEAYKAFALKVR